MPMIPPIVEHDAKHFHQKIPNRDADQKRDDMFHRTVHLALIAPA
jgi:hypothetical protein